MLSRRSFLRWSAGAAATALAAAQRESPAAPPTMSRPILMNHVGFRPRGTKRFLMADAAAEFIVIDPASGAICFAGKTTHRTGDFGPFTAGDFSSFTTPGTYQLRCGSAVSAPFAIGTDIYLGLCRNMLRYFQKQRCGDSGTGYNSPCHLDDGIRDDTGQRVNVTGGWHDACDVRKWVSATIYGMIGLARVLQLDGHHQLDRAAFLDELRWGNRYFLAMQEPAGYVMDWCGGDTGNHFTDNRPNTSDDRRIRTAACEQPAQYQFILAQALAAEAFRGAMPEEADRCVAAARRCLAWCEGQRRNHAMTHAAAVSAMLALYHTTSNKRLLPMIDKHLALLIELQAGGTAKGPDGFFFRDASRTEPLRDISDGNLPLIALSEAVLAFPDHPDANHRRAALRRHVDHLAEMSRRGAFDTITFGLYAKVDPGGDRRIG
ncbi:MAG: glycoside hydrolase family 9 protein, partial [Tepidisphaeraceae bacterium]